MYNIKMDTILEFLYTIHFIQLFLVFISYIHLEEGFTYKKRNSDAPYYISLGIGVIYLFSALISFLHRHLENFSLNGIVFLFSFFIILALPLYLDIPKIIKNLKKRYKLTTGKEVFKIMVNIDVKESRGDGNKEVIFDIISALSTSYLIIYVMKI